MDTFEAIRNRRSICQYKADKIDDETLKKVLEAARIAPSWANTQCWRFVVVKDSKVKEHPPATGAASPPAPPAAGAPATPPPPPPPSPIIQAPVVIAVCAELKKSGVRPDGTASTDKGDSWYMY